MSRIAKRFVELLSLGDQADCPVMNADSHDADDIGAVVNALV